MAEFESKPDDSSLNIEEILDILNTSSFVRETEALNPAAHDYDTKKPEPLVEKNRVKKKLLDAREQKTQDREFVANLAKYVERYGLTLAKLTPYQIHLMRIAEKLARFVKELKIDMSSVEIPSDEMVIVEKEVQKEREYKEFIERDVASELPTDNRTIAPLEDFKQLIHLTPFDQVLEDEFPDLFYYRLANRQVMRREWLEPTEYPISSYRSVPEIEMVEEQAPPTVKRFHASVLLDTSGSMDNSDRRGDFAKALALAFLLEAHEKDGFLHFRTFSSEVHFESTAKNKEQFTAMANRIIVEHRPSGGTSTQLALETAVKDIERDRFRHNADALLITDGLPERRLRGNPMRKTNLHTFIVGDIIEIKHSDYAGDLQKLHSWSKTFEEIDTGDFKYLLRSFDMIDAVRRELARAMEKLENKAVTEAEVERVMEEIEALNKILNALKQNFQNPGTGKPIRTKNKSINKIIEDIEKKREERKKAAELAGRPDAIIKEMEQIRKELSSDEFTVLIQSAIDEAKAKELEEAQRRRNPDAHKPIDMEMEGMDLKSLLSSQAPSAPGTPKPASKEGWLEYLLRALGIKK